jgi:hypothetical protein
MITLRDKESSKKEKEYPIVFDYRKFNFSKLEYIEPKKTGNSVCSSIYYRASINKVINLFIRTPVMNTISGICKKNNHYYIDLELNLNKGHSEFYDFMNKFDENNKQIVFQNSMEWFNQQLPNDILENYYTPSVNLITNDIPVIRIKIKSKGDVIIPKIFNNYGTEVDLSYISPKDEIEAILILDELKFFKEKFTPEWSLGQLKVFKKKTRETPIPCHYLLEDENDLKDNHIENNMNLSDNEDVDIKEEYHQNDLQKKLEQERLEKEKLEKARLKQEKIIKDRLEQERLEQERLEKEMLEQERLEQERLEQERLEQERLEQERLEQERIKNERLEKERLEKQKKIEILRKKEEKIRLEQEKLIREMEELNNDNNLDYDNYNSENNDELDINNSDSDNDLDLDSDLDDNNDNDDNDDNNDNDNYLNTSDNENENKYYKVDPDWSSILEHSNDSIEEIILS